MKISPICFGCEPLGGTDWGEVDIDAIEKAINIALELGLNFFDTAGVYGLGLSEERLSKILGNRRHDIVIATKGGLSWKNSNSGREIITKDSSPLSIRADVESSLKRLRLEVLPIFYVHWPDSNTNIEDTFYELSILKNEGKINSIGCSNFSAEQIIQACSVTDIDYLQTPMNILDGPIDQSLSDVCLNNNINIIAYNVLLHGLLTGKFDINSNFPRNDRRSRLPLFKGSKFKNAIEKIEDLKIKAFKTNNSLSHHAINWVLTQKNVSSALIGIKSPKQMIDNWSAIS